MAPTGKVYEVDWRVCNISNVHVTNNRRCFTQYTPIKTYLNLIDSLHTKLKVLGLGNVELEVETVQTRSGMESHRAITLRNVLYCPDASLNIIGMPMLQDHPMKALDTLRIGIVCNATDPTLWRLVSKVWLKEHRNEHSSADPNKIYVSDASWPDSERARCQTELEARLGNLTTTVRSLGESLGSDSYCTREIETVPASSAPNISTATPSRYTEEETGWMKTHYKGEYRFLRDHGLSIYRDEDRDEGLAILRALMSQTDVI